MYLVKTENSKIERFEGSKIPLYAILSHTWEEDEITFQEMQLGVADKKAGYKKVNQACLIAKTHGFDYIWIDTCCIDKTSSAELSEAINSMYRWYQGSGICYAYLADMSINATDRLSTSRWFTRGWTLQELIAPSIVIFLDKGWQKIGTKSSLGSIISKVTGIPNGILQGANPQSASIAERMSWAAKRETTRIEDLAYCLMGIFGINMPLLYGEGDKAFNRLQEEIMKISDDHSLFAWRGMPSSFQSLLASSPAAFSASSKIIPLNFFNTLCRPLTVNNEGIHLKLRTVHLETMPHLRLVILPCVMNGESAKRIGFYVTPRPNSEEYFTRANSRHLQLINITDSALSKYTEKLFCFRQRRQVSERQLPLEIASEQGNEVLIKFLLEKGTNFGFQCGDDQQLLYKSIENGHETVVKLLLEKGADLESRDDDRRTPLIHAAANGQEAIVKLLLEKGADFDSRDDNRRTPLTHAAANGHEAIVKLLLVKGADFDSRDDDRQTPLTHAVTNGYKPVAKLLLEKGADLELRDDSRWTPLLLAVANGQDAIVKLLLENGADLESRDDNRWTPLLLAAAMGQEAIVKLLLEKGADLESRDDDRWTPLTHAIANGHEAIVKLLLEKGANLESRDNNR